jgi:pyruvate formate lyase activating enzyme
MPDKEGADSVGRGPAIEAAWWRPLEDGALACELCPHRCVLREGATGICRVRRNVGGRMTLPFYGRLSSLALDPIEKKPLHHFLPGSSVLSAGFYGCNLHCPFCQNWSIAQTTDGEAEYVPVEDLVRSVLDAGSPSLAFTYSEPCVHFEYVLAAARAARAAGLRTVLVTNGCLNEGPARELLAAMDAANVDLKCWPEETYRRELGGDRKAVQAFIRIGVDLCLVEVTTLVVPRISDNSADFARIVEFLSTVSPDIPLHLSAYRPAYHYSEPPTDGRLLAAMAKTAESGLHYVYVGNLDIGMSDSHCPHCGALLVRRRGYATKVLGLEGSGPRTARCTGCGKTLPFVMA